MTKDERLQQLWDRIAAAHKAVMEGRKNGAEDALMDALMDVAALKESEAAKPSSDVTRPSAIECMDCHQVYDDLMPISLNIPRDQWLAIHPEGGGVLCANCLIVRASKLKHVINVTGKITFAKAYDEAPTTDAARLADELEKLVEKATPAPWIADDFCMECDRAVRIGTTDGRDDYYLRSATICECWTNHDDEEPMDQRGPRIGVIDAERNAKLIAWLRNNAHAIVKALREVGK